MFRVLFCLFIGVFFSFQSLADIYTVDKVAVDVTAGQATLAKKKAIDIAELKAFKILLRRLTVDDNVDWAQPSADDLDNMVKGYSVENEKMSTTQYVADFSVQFYPTQIRKFLASHNQHYSETKSKPILVLPVALFNGKFDLWNERTAWQEEWQNYLSNQNNLVSIALPDFDITDATSLTIDEALIGDKETILAFGNRYQAKEVVVAKYIENEGNYEVEMSYYTSEKDPYETVITKWYDETDVKKDQIRKDLVLSVIDRLTTSWKARSKVDDQTELMLRVRIPISSMEDWLELQEKIDKISVISSYEIAAMNIDMIIVDMNYRGALGSLKLAFEQQDILLENHFAQNDSSKLPEKSLGWYLTRN